jgi:N-acetylneuraminic acid mutarotase
VGDEEDLRHFEELDLRCMAWRQMTATPDPVVGHSAVLLNDRALLFGGWVKKAYSDVCDLFDPAKNTCLSALNEGMAGEFGLPWARRDHSMVVADKNVYLFGGWDSLKWSNSDNCFTEMWCLDSTWKWHLCEIYGETPLARRGHSLSYYPEDNCLVLFGGAYGYSRLLNDTYVFKLGESTSELVQTTNPPTPRAWHSGAIVKSRLFVFGGLIANYRTVNELWLLDLKSWVWTQADVPGGPSPRCGHMCLAVESSLVIFGGKGAKTNESMELTVLETTDQEELSRYLEAIRMNSIFDELKAMNIVPPQIPLHLSRARFYTPSDTPFNPKHFPCRKS